MPPSSFAQAQLEKYGWKEGQGLGKNSDGMKDAIQVTMKQDNFGLGKGVDSEWSFAWWDHAFNKACLSIQVDKDDGGDVKIKSEDVIEKRKREKEKMKLYGSFVKSGQAKDVEQDDFSIKVTDEELLKACEGRTARKGARIDQVAKVKRADSSILKDYIGTDTVTLPTEPSKDPKKHKKRKSKEQDDTFVKHKKKKRSKSKDDNETSIKHKKKN